MELCDLDAWTLSSMLQEGKTTSRRITESVLHRLEEREPVTNAFITVTRDLALAHADRADERIRSGKRRSPLDGIPVALKDNLCTRGTPTTCGSRILEGYVPPYDATAVQRILEAGCVPVGKTNLDEFAMGSSTENSAAGPSRNPHDPERVTGGSSGGSAAAVASGETIVALGSDTGGSVRQPAAYCGVCGIKPTYGRISRYGLVAFASSLDQIGCLGRTVKDCALVLNAVCGHDRKDSTSAAFPVPDFLEAVGRGLDGVRIGVPTEYFVEGLDAGIRARIEEALSAMERGGASVEEVSLPHTPYAVAAYYLIATAEASSNLARYDGVRYGLRANAQDGGAIQMYERTRSEGFCREVKRRILLGTYVLSAGYYDAYYLKAQSVRTLIKRDFDEVFRKVDCLVTPVSPCLPFRLGEKTEDPLTMYLVDIYTVSPNLAGLPAMSVPCGKVEGLPVGLQIIGKPFDEETVLSVAEGYGQAAEQD
ncbi:MAG: Asp-tRNA(Asn)/Glu-tRNA(Gln) amidotransferase subunit GatA [Deltaproteobacteria bacterium]|nr:Asp-tRNA(Asn)/Glu-tRNA(Gln) amidotransferase subunit GatA [Deltaproteobacteria bacterium]MBW1924282.1 Asp-tRNA(Asn)/Glu-tRNA(Gln) amidotransferase subunit GatA [Deltaproteobacteria bacterium]MBW1949451.1 Asp-tRNA(Asn)/Glu-tRNA(Gln) amidotransferase subunit GatA [Deltaproteobacteria bacterium]MBW2008779.1 Asp-tRNA(Asn)/Glu-tRNA(Gln) amidotransferase subunit GatA [Deltaproteobacteria bacterium]MBW2349060.1 Asp-tRNA(Asn)/Glu-tRNA(Gln) amidotransferase subunit GatA [Deltaproteobacteria bacterium